MGSDTGGGFKGKVFCIAPARPEIQGITPPLPHRIMARENQICVLYSGAWLRHWGRDILHTVREHGSSLVWQCYLGSFIHCKMNKQRKPACARCEFRDECREAAEIPASRRKTRRG